MYNKSIIFATIFSLFGGLILQPKTKEIKYISYEIIGDNFFTLKEIKNKVIDDYQKLSKTTISKTHENIIDKVDNFKYSDLYDVTYQNYNLKIICSEDTQYIFKGYLYQKENEVVDKKYFF